MSPTSRRLLFDLPGRYRIRVQDRLDPSWSRRLGDMAITVRQAAGQEPVTALTGEVTDQTALLGVLNTLYDMGFPLLKVERLGSLPSTESQVPSGETT
jgi:hypothetical protein